jgi:hypothetical protein
MSVKLNAEAMGNIRITILAAVPLQALGMKIVDNL